jgi:hypothetical protein
MSDFTKYQVSIQISQQGNRHPELVTLSEITGIDETRLNEQFAEQPSLYAFFAIQLAEADRLVKVAQQALDQEYAAADSHYRKQYQVLEQKYTEAVIDGDVKQDEDYNKAVDVLQKAQHNKAKIKAIVDALKMRAEMLVSLGAHLRHEGDMTGMSIRQVDATVDKAKRILDKKRKKEQV